MNDMIFSKLTKKQVIDAYNDKDYKQVIRLLKNIFMKRNNYLKYLNANASNIDGISLRKFRDILYIWTVIEEFKKLINKEIEILTVSYMQEFDKDYVRQFFTVEEIEMIKKESKKYYDKQKNKLLLRNYEEGNFEYVIDSLKFDYKDHKDFEQKISNCNKSSYGRLEIAPLREISHIYRFINKDISDNDMNYKYAMIKYLISIYKNMNEEYLERFLLRQKKIGNDLDCLFNVSLLKLLTEEDRKIINEIYNNNIKNGLKVNKGVGLYNNLEYTLPLHTVMTILEIPSSSDLFDIIKHDYNYTPGDIKRCINSKQVKKIIKEDSLKRIINIYNDYKDIFDVMNTQQQIKKTQSLGIELGKIITYFLDNNIDIDSYFNQNNLLKKEYKSIIKYVKNYCPKVYERLVAYRIERITQASELVMQKLNDNDDFSEIDYYAITNISYRIIRDYLKKKDFNSYIKFNKFLNENQQQQLLNDQGLKVFYESSQIFRIEDEFGSVKMIKATIDDKKYIVDYLKSINAPITSKNIYIGLKRLLSNNLNLEENSYQKRITL